MSDSKLVLETNLQMFFYDHLKEINRGILNPLSHEILLYSSYVLNEFGDPHKLFDIEDNRFKQKILGIKLLESTHATKEKQKVLLRDIAETSLFICGFFSDSFNKKIYDISYYEELGKIAYLRLDTLAPSFYDIPDFYKMMAHEFSEVRTLLNLVSKKSLCISDPKKAWLLEKARPI